ncbi:MAG: glycosyltransferase family 4 protein [Blastochloris sp.]|nr:glycosyltransferase family 4 protein [Blastochloris sp.]
MNILMVSARYYPFMGGTETHIYEVARRMAAHPADKPGQRVTVLTTDPKGDLPREETVNGVTIRRVRAYPKDRDYYFAPALYGIITRGGWDVVHVQGYHTFVAPLAMFAAWRARLPYVITFHSGGHSSASRHAARGLQRRLLRPLIRRAAARIGVSEFEARLFAESVGLPLDQFDVIPNGARLPELDAPATARPDVKLIVSPGRLERYKGHQRAIQALPHVLAVHPDARLRIVGSGPYEPELRALAQQTGVESHIEIGSIPPSDRQGMAALLAQSSLVVLFSDYEAHPVAVMEALSMRRPVLVAETSGLAELAARGLVRSVPLASSETDIARAIIQQLDDPHLAADIALPTWEGCADALLAVYRRVTQNI